MIRKLFDVMAVICGILFFVFAMALDSPSNYPIYVCFVSSAYLFIYVLVEMRGDKDDELDR